MEVIHILGVNPNVRGHLSLILFVASCENYPHNTNNFPASHKRYSVVSAYGSFNCTLMFDADFKLLADEGSYL